MGWPVGILLIGLGVLYDRGYLPVKSMSAIHFIGNMGAGTNQTRASFGSATGQVKRVLRFKESRPSEFTFKGKITKGTVQAYVLDGNNIPELVLDNDCPSGILHTVKGQRYHRWCRRSYCSLYEPSCCESQPITHGGFLHAV